MTFRGSYEPQPKPSEQSVATESPLTRAAAIALLQANGHPGTGERLRNYEIEMRLRELPGAFRTVTFWVAELCPFNGKYCQHGRRLEVRQKLNEIEVTTHIDT